MRTAYRDEGDDDRFAYAVAMPALGRPAETGEPTRFIKYVINHVDARNERSYSQGMDAKRMKLIRGKLELTQEGMGNLLGVDAGALLIATAELPEGKLGSQYFVDLLARNAGGAPVSRDRTRRVACR